jgi:26S proteasome regulatory subunit T5
MRSELGRIQHELQAQQETIKENEKKIKQNKTLPYLVSNIIEVLDINPEEEEEIEGEKFLAFNRFELVVPTLIFIGIKV